MWSKVHDSLLAFADAQTTETLQQTIRATSRIGKKFEIPKWAVMLHVADHATYHRGQLNSMIKLAGGKPSMAMAVPWAVSQGFGKAIE